MRPRHATQWPNTKFNYEIHGAREIKQQNENPTKFRFCFRKRACVEGKLKRDG